ncbi:MAG TPA: alanine--tRNA ligase, partial [Candidatus Aenigmarchaeota archaeon]|nr:alanine--tRNA ligase [Candidatus Aenigmarchaeota archaeon]
EKYVNTRKRCIEILEKDLKRGVEVNTEYLLKLYDSHGINPELVKEIFEKRGIEVRIPSDFYKRVQELHEKRRRKKEGRKKIVDVSKFKETRPLYYEDLELGEFDAKVLGILRKRYVILDKTAFYPTGGGQVHDTGFIGGSRVIDVFKIGNVIVHEVEEPKFRVGKVIRCRVDLQRRKAIMKNHTATHIINRACVKVLGDHVWQHGSYKDEEMAHLDITHFKNLSREELSKIEKIANEVVRKGLNVKVYYLHRNEAEKKFGFRIYQGGVAPGKYIRIVEIEGFDAQACGGLHCRNTREIEVIKIISTERVQDGVIRLNFKTGKKAIEEIQFRDKILEELRELWKVKLEDIPKTAKRFFEEWKRLRKENDELKEKLLKSVVLSSIKESDICYLDVDFIESMGMVIKVVNELAKELIGKVIVFHCKEFGYAVSRKANVSALEELSKFYEKVEGDNLNAKGFKRKK